MIYQIKPVIGVTSKKKLIDYIKKNNWLTEYKYTTEFEKKFAKFTNSKNIFLSILFSFSYDNVRNGTLGQPTGILNDSWGSGHFPGLLRNTFKREGPLSPSRCRLQHINVDLAVLV